MQLKHHDLNEPAPTTPPLPPGLQKMADAGVKVIPAVEAHVATAVNNDPGISATKATKEAADVLAAAVLAVVGVWLSGQHIEGLNEESIAAIIGALLVLWKFASKFYRDYTKKR